MIKVLTEWLEEIENKSLEKGRPGKWEDHLGECENTRAMVKIALKIVTANTE